jgi:hypothetical protein
MTLSIIYNDNQNNDTQLSKTQNNNTYQETTKLSITIKRWNLVLATMLSGCGR